VGQYIEAKAIYERLLARNENDYEVRYSLGALYEQPLREDERAKAEWGKIPVGAAPFRRARIGIASALTNQRFFADAVAEMKKLLAEHPGDGNALARLVRTMGKAGHWGDAVPLARGFIEANAKDLRAVLAVRVALGRALLDGHQFNEAAAEFQQALALPGGGRRKRTTACPAPSAAWATRRRPSTSSWRLWASPAARPATACC
jgi:Flp pilus assembly protein TadD